MKLRQYTQRLGLPEVLLLLLAPRLLSAQLSAEEPKEPATGQTRPAGRLSVHLAREQRPAWCWAEQRPAGAWHTLSDDEYSDESPYLQCALPRGSPSQVPKLPSQRRAARAARQGSGSHDSCRAAIRVPRVAMMFLTQGPLPHEGLWERWLASAEGVLPVLCAANAVCARGGFSVLSDLRSACSAEDQKGENVHDRQFLFSVYIHAQPGYPLRERDSVFFGRDSIVPRVFTSWGDHSTVEATRRLLQAALRDDDNQRFILLSESCVPLYSPLIVYQQLMHEWRSRISACALPGWDRGIERYNVRMAAGRREKGRIPVEKWRKHMHWFSLLRFHAELVANDTEIVDTFARDCFTGFDILSAEAGNYRFCIGDEHYVSTLLAVYGLDAQTDCMGRLTHATFSLDDEHPEHPRAYSVDEVNATLFRSLRGARDEVIAATNYANAAFRRAGELDRDDATWRLPYPDLKQLRSQYPLFARKFPAATAAAVMRVLEDNDAAGAQLNIFGGLHRARGLPPKQTSFSELMRAATGATDAV